MNSISKNLTFEINFGYYESDSYFIEKSPFRNSKVIKYHGLNVQKYFFAFFGTFDFGIKQTSFGDISELSPLIQEYSTCIYVI